jgi:hypothetical protein
MKVVTTPRELMDRLRWDEACSMLGLNPWAVSEGQMDPGDEITLTEAQAFQLGLVPSRLDSLAAQVREPTTHEGQQQ